MSKSKELFLEQMTNNLHILNEMEEREYFEFLENERMRRCNEAVDQLNFEKNNI